MKIVVGLVGQMGSGKGEFSKFLREKGFTHYSLSDRVREEAKRRNLEPKRETLQDIGDALRKEFGNDILARKTEEIIAQSDNRLIVIDSIRNPGEVKYLKKKLGVYILGITAYPSVRLKRYLASANYDPKTSEAFFKASRRDSGEEEENYGQQVGACLKMTDSIIENNGSLEELREKGARFLKEHFKFKPEGTSFQKEAM